jgi:hypothetical protein
VTRRAAAADDALEAGRAQVVLTAANAKVAAPRRALHAVAKAAMMRA